MFISSLAYRPHVSGENSHRKHIFSKTLSRVGFLKTLASRLRVDRQKWRFSNTLISYVSYTSSMTHALKGMLSYFHRFSFFVWTGENDLNTLHVDTYFLKREEKICFQKYPDACGWGHNRCINHYKIILFQDLVSRDTTLFPQYKFTLFALTHTSIPFLKPAVNPRMYFLIHGVK